MIRIRQQYLTSLAILSTASCIALELWAGSCSWSGAIAATARDWACYVIDILWGCDICQPEFKDECLRFIPRCAAVHLGVECTSWSIAAHPAYRARGADIWGFNFDDPAKNLFVRCANTMVLIAIDIFLLCLCLGISVSWENPATSMMWDVPAVRALINRDDTYFIDVYYCGYGRNFEGHRRILTNDPSLLKLQNKCRHGHGGHAQRLSGTTTINGVTQSTTKLANKYPARLVSKWAKLLNNSDLVKQHRGVR